MRIEKLGAFAANLLFPPRCPWCGAVLGFVPVCDTCREKVSAAARPAGVPVEKKGRALAFVEEAYAAYWYESPVKDAILRMKFSDRPETARFLAGEIARFLQAAALPAPDGIVPVPSGKKELRRRGYDVPLLLAQGLAKAMGLPAFPDQLYKKQDTPRQMELSGEERRANLLGAFGVHSPHLLEGRTVLLVDDVLTTGSTLNECAKMLRAAGAKACYAACVACVREGKEREAE